MFNRWIVRSWCSRTLSILSWSMGEKKIRLMDEMEGKTFMDVTSLPGWTGLVGWGRRPLPGVPLLVM